MSKKLTQDEVIAKFKIVHPNDRYDYSKFVYVNAHTKGIIICNVCKLKFTQISNSHLKKRGCPECAKKSLGLDKRLNVEDLIESSKNLHKNFHGSPLYEYHLIKEYKGIMKKVPIYCIKHKSIFHQSLQKHLTGQGCPECAKNKSADKQRSNIDDFIKKSKILFKDMFDFSKFIYVNAFTKSEIKCKKCENTFWQTPNNHLRGGGCPICNKKFGRLSEFKLKNYIESCLINILILSGKTPQFLKIRKKNNQSIDIFIPDYNIGIEYQGGQHFKPVNFLKGRNTFSVIKERDERKRLLCEANGMKLFYFTYTPKDVPLDYPHKVYSNEQELINVINQHISEINKKVA